MVRQWEFQAFGSKNAKDAADDSLDSSYLLLRVAEKFGLKLSFILSQWKRRHGMLRDA